MSKNPQSDPFQLLDTTPQPITAARRSALDKLARMIIDLQQSVNLLFVCTHNSRRSQMAQAWAAWATQRFDTPVTSIHSAGTEATALHPNAAEALRAVGFHLQKDSNSSNQTYHLSFPETTQLIPMWSKTWQDSSIPRENLAAIMVCSDAEANCPFIPGALIRYPLPYSDPKAADDTAKYDKVYLDTCQQIGREIAYLFSQITND